MWQCNDKYHGKHLDGYITKGDTKNVKIITTIYQIVFNTAI